VANSQNIKNIVQKLDLEEYIQRFSNHLAREKPVLMHGDINQHYRFIKALFNVEIPVPPKVPNLDTSLMRLKVQAVLGLDEIYAFVTIVLYFNRLRTQTWQEPLSSWIHAIEIPSAIAEIPHYFTTEGTLNPERDEELLDLERSIKQNRIDIKESLYKLAHASTLREYLVDTQIHFYGGEETLLVRGGFNHAIKATVVARSASGYFYILPQTISHLKEKESALLSRKEELVYRYCKRFSATFTQWERFLSYINKEFDRFDHYQARVMFARSRDYEFVLPSKSHRIKLEAFAHPAIVNPIPVSMDFDKKIILVTGVNAGGKTMLLKSMLSAVYMSKQLLPFRCDASRTEIGHFRHIEAIIDDPQSVKNDISTFAGRMREFSRLFETENAIVGVDEIELGTDSDEAASLFRVMLEALKIRNISFIITTHHKRLASLMASDDEVTLVAALYDEARRMPTYTFLQGSIGKSYAFETAQRYGIPEVIIERAKAIYGEDKENLNELIEKSTMLEKEMREKIAKVDEELKTAEKKRLSIEEEHFTLQEEYRKKVALLEKRYNEATQHAREALKAKDTSEGHRLLNEAHKIKTTTLATTKQEDKTPPTVGDRVKYRSHKGTLLTTHGTDATIDVDGLKMRVALSDLKRITAEPKIKSHKPKIAQVNVEKSSASVSIKLLGMYADEAIEAVDKFLSDAMVNSIREVQIIHGTGSGVLARVISEYLKNHPKIEKFYRVNGNLGITVVEL